MLSQKFNNIFIDWQKKYPDLTENQNNMLDKKAVLSREKQLDKVF